MWGFTPDRAGKTPLRRPLHAADGGLCHRSETTFGSLTGDVLEHFVTGFERGGYATPLHGLDRTTRMRVGRFSAEVVVEVTRSSAAPPGTAGTRGRGQSRAVACPAITDDTTSRENSPKAV